MQPPRGPLFPTFQPAQSPVNPQQGGVVDTGRVSAASRCQTERFIEQRNGQPIYISPFQGGTAVGTPRPGMVVQPALPPGVVAPGVIVQPGQPPSPDN